MMAGKKSGLGRGLDALFPEKTVQSKPKTVKTVKEEKKVAVDTKKSSQQETSNGERMMKISMIEPNREQPRKKFDEDALQELSESIKQYGILQPLLVSDKNDYYEIVAGERRWRAAKMAGLKEVPVVVKEFSTQEIVEISLIENIQREDLNPVEEAMAYKRLIDEFHLKQTGFDILMFLGNNPQYKYAKDIVEIRKIKANLVSIHVDQLVDQGYLSRIDVPGDRRKVKLILNEKANDVVKKGKVFQSQFFSSLFINIDGEHKKIFKETLELMEKNLEDLMEEK